MISSSSSLEVMLERTRPVFLCSDPECMAVPMLNCVMFRSRASSWRFFFLTERLLTKSEDSVLQMEVCTVTDMIFFGYHCRDGNESSRPSIDDFYSATSVPVERHLYQDEENHMCMK